jgi:CheY-like chemotaxis protein
MAHILRSAGHAPVFARDARSAIREAWQRPGLILLDLGLPDVPGEDLLTDLIQMPETAHAPIVVVTGKSDCAARLREQNPPGLAAILLKPVNGPALARAVHQALENGRRAMVGPREAMREIARRDVVFRLIVQGPDRLAAHVYRRLCADRVRNPQLDEPAPLEWPDIARWALLEGLVSEAEAGLIGARDEWRSPGDATPVGS